MAARSKVSQPRFIESLTPHRAWFSSVTESNQGKARAACRDSLAVIKALTSDSEQFRREVSKSV